MFKRLLILFSILAIGLFPVVTNSQIQAASFTTLSNTMSRLETSAASNHTIAFTLATTWDATETLTVDFDDGFDTTGFLNSDPADYDITWAGAEKTIVANGACAADSIEITTVNTTTDVFTFTLCATSGSSGATDAIVIEIGTHATAGATGDDQIDNPGTTGSKVIALAGTINDSAQLAVPIMDSDQVTVTATVDPTITSDLTPGAAPYTCALGTLDAAAVNGCTIINTVSTNASSGYNTTIVEDGDLCSPSVAICTNSIADVADGTVTIGAEEYGVSTSDADAADITATYDGTCNDGADETGSAITGTAQIYADETAAIANDATTLCFSASITATTESGNYSHVTTHITTGNF